MLHLALSAPQHFKVLYGFFPYLAQMITSMRWCVTCYDLWPWPISSRSFSHDFVIKLQKYGTSSHVHSIACTVLDGFSPYLAILITSMRGCVLWPLCPMTFDLDLYLQGYLAVTLPISWSIHMWCKSTHEWTRTMCHLSFPGQQVRGQGHRGRSNFCRLGGGYPSRSLISNF